MATTQSQSWPFAQPCGCNLETGICSKHRPMMARIHEAWFNGSSAEGAAVERFCDGFGAGLGSQGDWSAIRDSSPAAIEAMDRAVRSAQRAELRALQERRYALVLAGDRQRAAAAVAGIRALRGRMHR